MTSITPQKQTTFAASLTDEYLARTGIHPVNSERRARRYLWTDAHAVQVCFGLSRTNGSQYRERALALIDTVHDTLGRHRDDDERDGWISGLPLEEALERPTAGGLRIGKYLPERKVDEPFDESLEWKRDGQYFHHSSRWICALMTAYHETGETRYREWAREFMAACNPYFTETPSSAMKDPFSISGTINR